MKREGLGSWVMLALACSLVAVLFSTLACVYVATYLENGSALSKSLNKLSEVLEKNR